MRSAELFLFIFLAFLFLSCASGRLHLNPAYGVKQPVPGGQPDYTIYAVGDVGEINDQSKAVMAHIKALARDDTQPGNIIFLGDNIYPAGFPPASNIKRHLEAQEILMNQIYGLQSYNGEIIFIPGNHDWNEFKPGGLEAIRRQGDFLESLGNPQLKMIPDNGCGGPVIMELNTEVVMIIIDSQWWIQDWEKELAMNDGCMIRTREDFIHAFHQTVEEYSKKQIIVALHHPLYSQGAHGGHFSWREHIFPLSRLVEWLYLPLPVIGSIYPFYRSLFGHNQDITHPGYSSLKEGLLNGLVYNGEMIFLSGHEHNLQYILKEGDHFLVSGSGAKKSKVSTSKDLIFGHQANGFMELNFYNAKGIHLSIYEVSTETGALENVFSRFLIEKLH